MVLASGSTLLRQLMVTGAEGVVPTMLVRGSPNKLLQFEENFGTHPLVRSFESVQGEGGQLQGQPAPAPPSNAAPRAQTATRASAAFAGAPDNHA
jgi:hypothetical protein